MGNIGRNNQDSHRETTHKRTQTHGKKEFLFTQRADGILALIHLLGHHPADGHQTLRDAAAGFHKRFFGRSPETNTHTEQNR